MCPSLSLCSFLFCPFISSSICLSVYPPICLFICLSICLSVLPLTSFLGNSGDLLKLRGEVEGVKVVHLVAGEALQWGGGRGGVDGGDGGVGAADGTLGAGHS